jgi:hypothetical protein
MRERFWPAAMVKAALYNVHNDWDKKPDGWSIAECMPGAVIKTEEEKLIEFAEAVLNGESIEEDIDPDEMRNFRKNLEQLQK